MSLNFDSYGRLPNDPDYDGSQLGSMELYNLKIQKLKEVFNDYDAVTKKYVDTKLEDLIGNAGTAFDTLREIELAINGEDQTVVGGMIKEIGDLSAAVATEKARAEGVEGGLASRITILESDPTTGTSVTAVQNELNYVEAAAGLSATGNYTADPSSNYLTLAVSLKDADDKLDTQLKAEEVRASGVEALLNTNLTNHIANYETEKKTNDNDKLTIGNTIANLTSSDIAEGDKLFYTDQRTKTASVHNYSPFNPSLRTYDPPVEATVGYAFELLNAELTDIHTKENADDTRHNDLTVSLSTVAGSVATEQSRASVAEGLLSGRVDVFEEGLNNGMEPENVYYQANLGVQAVVDDLRGGIESVNAQREANKTVADNRHSESEERHNNSDDRHTGHDAAIELINTNKFDKSGGTVTGGTGFTSDVLMQSTVALNVQHANQAETTNGTGKYLYFSNNWRLYGKSDGSRLVFEFNSGSQETPNWKSAVPFISSS
jgi:hypothetical protein